VSKTFNSSSAATFFSHALSMHNVNGNQNRRIAGRKWVNRDYLWADGYNLRTNLLGLIANNAVL
jgi:hypothetical protein